MENFVTRSKYVSETISILVDFSDILPAGQTIQGVPTVSIALETGDDPAPAGILYLGIFVHKGTTVEQRFRLGVPGTVYEITWQIVSTSSEIFEKTTYLAILPTNFDVIPVFKVLYLTSQPYPYFCNEVFTAGFQIQNGILVPAIVRTSTLENLSSNFQINNGLLVPVVLYYTAPPENLTASFAVNDGTLVDIVIRYYAPPENVSSNFSIGNGTLPKIVIRYSSGAETMQTSFSINNGTLTHG